MSFSKLLLLLESGIVLYTTYEGFALAKFAVASGFMGTLPWIATMVTAAWGAYGTSAACYYAKAKAEKHGWRRDVRNGVPRARGLRR
ncbi:MAG: hypothetical protein ACLRSD_07290 [Oscillibacter sp.]